MTEPEWLRLNRANWDERVAIHLSPASSYDLTDLRAGRARLCRLTTAALGPVDGLTILHPQCHFGLDSLTCAQLGAIVTGVDFSPKAIEAARALAEEIGLAERARFVLSSVYDMPANLPDAGGFDRVFVSWGALCWLPDIHAWARIIARFLRPGATSC